MRSGIRPMLRRTIVAMIKPRLLWFCCSIMVMMPPASRTGQRKCKLQFEPLWWSSAHILVENTAGGYHAVRGRYFQFRIIRYKVMGTIGTYRTTSATAAAVWGLMVIFGCKMGEVLICGT